MNICRPGMPWPPALSRPGSNRSPFGVRWPLKKSVLKFYTASNRFGVERYKSGLGTLDELSAARSRTEIAPGGSERTKRLLASVDTQVAGFAGTLSRRRVVFGRRTACDHFAAHGPTLSLYCSTVPISRRPWPGWNRRLTFRMRRTRRSFRNSGFRDRSLTSPTRLGNLGGVATYWSILGSLFQPLFDGRRKINESRARRIEADASLMDLHEVVLRALKEVEDAFGLERDLAAQSQALAVAVRESEKKQPLLRRAISAGAGYHSKPVVSQGGGGYPFGFA